MFFISQISSLSKLLYCDSLPLEYTPLLWDLAFVVTPLTSPLTDNGQKYKLVFRNLGLVTTYPILANNWLMLNFCFLFYFILKQNKPISNTILPIHKIRQTKYTNAGPIGGFSRLFIVAPTEMFVLVGWSEMSSGPTTMPPGRVRGGLPDLITDFQTN